MTPRIVVSLDFELRWGLQDVLGEDFTRYRANLEGVRDAVPAMLELFGEHGVHATWAIVGALACEGWDEWVARAPAWPRYLDGALHWKDGYRLGDPTGALHFAPDLVERVRRAPGQELGSHTFSHAYLGEPGLVRRDAEADAAAVGMLFRDRWGTFPRSFVFPRNQVAFTDVLSDQGIRVWRDNPAVFWAGASAAAERVGPVRLARLADSLLPLGARRYDVRQAAHRASYFVRFNLGGLAWRAHLSRLAEEARRLAPFEVLHLWWHPHNLGHDVPGCSRRLRELLEAVADVPSTPSFYSMGELAA